MYRYTRFLQISSKGAHLLQDKDMAEKPTIMKVLNKSSHLALGTADIERTNDKNDIPILSTRTGHAIEVERVEVFLPQSIYSVQQLPNRILPNRA